MDICTYINTYLCTYVCFLRLSEDGIKMLQEKNRKLPQTFKTKNWTQTKNDKWLNTEVGKMWPKIILYKKVLPPIKNFAYQTGMKKENTVNTSCSLSPHCA